MEWIWLGVIISLLLVEFVSLNFTSLWFAISAIISFILLKCNQNYIVQVLSFMILGMVLILIVRPRIIEKLRLSRDNCINKIVDKYPFMIKFIPTDINVELNDKKNNKINKNIDKKIKHNKNSNKKNKKRK